VAVAALGLACFTVTASVIMLNFWDMEGPARDAAKSVWQTNLAVIGGPRVAGAQALRGRVISPGVAAPQKGHRHNENAPDHRRTGIIPRG
jgi:hypothetical protein